MFFIITKQNVINNSLEFISSHSKYEIALAKVHKLLNEYDEKYCLKIKELDVFSIHLKGFLYGSEKKYIYRIIKTPELDNDKEENKEENKPKKYIKKINVKLIT